MASQPLKSKERGEIKKPPRSSQELIPERKYSRGNILPVVSLPQLLPAIPSWLRVNTATIGPRPFLEAGATLKRENKRKKQGKKGSREASVPRRILFPLDDPFEEKRHREGKCELGWWHYLGQKAKVPAGFFGGTATGIRTQE